MTENQKILIIPSSILIGALIVGAAIFLSGNKGAKTNGTPLPSIAPANISLAGEPVEGSANAKVTMIEFSDFQCPFCGRFFSDAYPQIKQNYIDAGKVKLVFKNFPLTQIHANAEKAAEASECAFEQNKFWEYHDKLFQNQNNLGVSDLKKYAQQVDLDAQKFNSCLDTGKYASRVSQELQEGIAAGVDGTPSFFINGNKIVGAQPFSVFQQAIDTQLK